MEGSPIQNFAGDVHPVRIPDAELTSWAESAPLTFSLAYFLARYAPRGQGWFPRAIGRSLCRGMKLVLRTVHQAKLAVDPRSLDYYTFMLKLGGMVDGHIRDACLQVLRPGDVFYDIGANAGLISVEVAQVLHGQVQVLAFEPQPWLAWTAAVSGRLNDFPEWWVYAVMLGREVGTAQLFVPSVTAHASAISRKKGARSIQCPVVTLDGLVESEAIPPPHVIKIDVEGGERDVFAGGARTIAAHAPFIVFEADANMKRFGYGRQDLFEQLNHMAAYRFYSIRNRGFVPLENESDDAPCPDVMAVPAHQAARFR